MAMDNVRMLVALEEKFHCCSAKKGESLPVVVVAIKYAAVEKVPIEVRLDKEAFQAIHPPEINVAMNPVLIIGNPQVAMGLGQARDAVVPHTVVFGENDLNRIAA